MPRGSTRPSHYIRIVAYQAGWPFTTGRRRCLRHVYGFAFRYRAVGRDRGARVLRRLVQRRGTAPSPREWEPPVVAEVTTGALQVAFYWRDDPRVQRWPLARPRNRQRGLAGPRPRERAPKSKPAEHVRHPFEAGAQALRRNGETPQRRTHCRRRDDALRRRPALPNTYGWCEAVEDARRPRYDAEQMLPRLLEDEPTRGRHAALPTACRRAPKPLTRRLTTLSAQCKCCPGLLEDEPTRGKHGALPTACGRAPKPLTTRDSPRLRRSTNAASLSESVTTRREVIRRRGVAGDAVRSRLYGARKRYETLNNGAARSQT
jgi:hypothetical protein